jgi:hypothetical protein
MTLELASVVDPFVRRGLFPSAEAAVTEIARDYVVRQIERYRSIESSFQARYGMSYEQFDEYLRARSKILSASPNQTLNQAIMVEEDDAMDWKIARDMLQSWLGLQREVPS